MKDGKLVRDKIPEIIERHGKRPVTHIAPDKEYWDSLKQKLQEEVGEFLEAENEEELADVLEVLYAVCDFKKWGMPRIEELRKKKSGERGGFEGRIILDRIR